MIFVDTSAWFAIFSRRDANHAVALDFLRSLRETLTTADFVVDETLTLLRARGEGHRAIVFGERIVTRGWADVQHVTHDDFHAAWEMFRGFQDKAWSFTDCTSRVVMERLNIQRAFAFDDHFRQFGNVVVAPP